MKMNLKTLYMPLMAGSLFLAGCDQKYEDRPKKTMDDVTYYIIRDGVVGVEQNENKEALFLHKGNIKSDAGMHRRSVYYLNEGAVITEFHSGSDHFSETGINPRPVRQMLDFEFKEFNKAKEFYEAQSALNGLSQEHSSYKKDSTVKASDSLSGGPK